MKTKPMIRRPIARPAIALLALLSAAGCDDVAAPVSDLAEARRLWASTRPAAYEITLQRDCFCGPDARGPVVLTVRGGRVESRRYVGTGAAVDARLADAFPTVEGIFDVIEDAVRRDAPQVDAAYDASRGFPTRVWIDYDRRIADEETGFTVQSFRALP